MGVEAPKKSLVENYLIEIARNYHVEYEPDPSMFLVGAQQTAHVSSMCCLFYPCSYHSTCLEMIIIISKH